MFKHLSRYDRIMVTGPQRAGTTIAARIIAHDTGFEYIDEERIGIDNVELFTSLQKLNHFVLQAPALAHIADSFNGLVVFMIRPVEDIIKSQTRINWPAEHIELAKYGAPTGPIAAVKYGAWEAQKIIIKDWMELKYEDLKGHGFFVNNRENFGPRQWKK